jgi:hypothetical protein
MTRRILRVDDVFLSKEVADCRIKDVIYKSGYLFDPDYRWAAAKIQGDSVLCLAFYTENSFIAKK